MVGILVIDHRLFPKVNLLLLPLAATAKGGARDGRTGILTGADEPHRAYRMPGEAAEIGFKVSSGCHVSRTTGITVRLEADGSLETAHESLARLICYDRAGDEITLDETEQIGI